MPAYVTRSRGATPTRSARNALTQPINSLKPPDDLVPNGERQVINLSNASPLAQPRAGIGQRSVATTTNRDRGCPRVAALSRCATTSISGATAVVG